MGFSQAPTCLDSVSTENREIKRNVKSGAFRKQRALVVSMQTTCSNAVESIAVNKHIQGPSLHTVNDYVYSFLSRAFEFHRSVSKILMPPKIWQRKGRRVQPERPLSSNSTLSILTMQSKAGKA